MEKKPCIKGTSHPNRKKQHKSTFQNNLIIIIECLFSVGWHKYLKYKNLNRKQIYIIKIQKAQYLPPIGMIQRLYLHARFTILTTSS